MNKVLHGDCLELMKDIPDKSIDMTLTSPPYDNLRDYNGYSFDFEGVVKELYRVTKEGGVVVWVVGDATIKGSETGTSFKQALFFKEIGFNLHDTMIYETEKPPLTHKRYEQKFEYMFIFSKGKPKTFNPILIPKKYMDNRLVKAFTRNKTNEHSLGFSSDKTEVIKGNIWKFGSGLNKDTKERIKFQHPAVFPDKLAEDHILSWSNEGDIVLDPMAGSGTTLKMAKKNNRNYIGIEISQEYIDIINKRLQDHENTL